MYRTEKNSLQILLSSTQAGPGRKVKQEKEDISRNHVPRLFLGSVVSNEMAALPSSSDWVLVGIRHSLARWLAVKVHFVVFEISGNRFGASMNFVFVKCLHELAGQIDANHTHTHK